MNTIYYGLATINGASQTRATNVIAATTTAPGANAILYASGTGTNSALSWLATASGALYATSANGAVSFGTLPVQQGGTGMSTGTYTNALVLTNSSTATNAFQVLQSTSGALYSTGSNKTPSFGTLPVSYGGTGMTTGTYTNAVILTNTSTVTSAFTVARAKSGAFYSTGTDVAPSFGTLPVGQGGTGNTTGTAAYVDTAADTSNTLYPLGVTSSATTSIKRDTSLAMVGSTFRPTASTITGNIGNSSYPFNYVNARYHRMYGYGNDTLAVYGNMEVYQYGLACTTEGTAGQTGIARLTLGNATATSTAVGSGTNNARGQLVLYATNTRSVTIQAPDFGGNRTLTIGNATNTGYLVATSTTAAVGGTQQAIYISNTGVATAISTASLKAGMDGAGNTISSTYLPLSGGTVTGTLILSRTTDASGTADNKPALIVGGASTASHIEIDGNEILAKGNGTTPGTLYLQDSSGTVEIAGTGGLIVSKGHAVVAEGKDWVLKASSSASTDPGDILFQNSSGTEIGRIYKVAGRDEFDVRYSASGSSYKIYTQKEITCGTGDPSGGSNLDIYIKYTA